MNHIDGRRAKDIASDARYLLLQLFDDTGMPQAVADQIDELAEVYALQDAALKAMDAALKAMGRAMAHGAFDHPDMPQATREALAAVRRAVENKE